ncbi:integral membrane protein [Pyrenophora tritici-repentis Pt-1C-BFP]|uniref:Integral membrane protein n=1 Tax=Pyrenophora tritici-repentis (strain Pt-1C-BFP) TaxID=426418 RepID=B2WHF1_PYRTR|nr:uncharacterized protein PTRG_09410 [Pyrenophora tritici-repentis Pt-1C-BFP]EDU42461.1 integral membrane protein [Pyrenophora tritici-repentis Pt-1C-BFP]
MLGTIVLVVVTARIWARVFIQRNVGADDWIIIVALVKHLHLNRHIWDVPSSYYVPERKITFIIYLLYFISGGLIKTSILLFYRRLDNRCITRSFRLATWINIVAIIIFMVSFSVVLLTACAPTAAFWLQFDVVKQIEKYEYTCWIDEGAYILSGSVISAVQDGVTAFLPTLLFWDLKIARRQKIALGMIFALGYVVCAVACTRSFFIWRTFNDDLYDSTWLSWPVWVLTVVEVHLGMICASAPALKVFCCHYFRMMGDRYGAGSRGVSELDWSVVSASASKGSQEAIVKEADARSMDDLEQGIVLKETTKMESTERTEVMETFVFS